MFSKNLRFSDGARERCRTFFAYFCGAFGSDTLSDLYVLPARLIAIAKASGCTYFRAFRMIDFLGFMYYSAKLHEIISRKN